MSWCILESPMFRTFTRLVEETQTSDPGSKADSRSGELANHHDTTRQLASTIKVDDTVHTKTVTKSMICNFALSVVREARNGSLHRMT